MASLALNQLSGPSVVFQAQLSSQYSFLKQALEEESERLEEQINDLTELHQHEVTNIKQVSRTHASMLMA